ncbi:MAG TPA: LD-carboxypeptidase [Candidatus Polarisedimenticolia bacterium]|nr:LD-carboxypeptidase [Candidatus Polarisedimenticolia bacterium]
MKSLLPPALRPGDRIGVVAPAGPVREADLDGGLACLERRGYRVSPGTHLRSRQAYLAGGDDERAADLNRLLADPEIRAIWFARGGYGAPRIIDRIDFRPLKRHPKALIGYSDLTVVHAAAYRRLGIATFHGPMVSELGHRAAYDEGSLWRALEGDGRSFAHEIPAASIVREGAGEGPLVGGCLSLLVSLVGTSYEPPLRGAILFWEEVGEEPYRIDRMLAHLRLAGRLKGLRGMVVGRLVNCQPKDPANDLPLAEILAAHLRGTDFPVVVDFPAGHCPGKITLPLGRRVRLDSAAGRLALSAR